MLPTNLTAEQLKIFSLNGYIIIKDFCSQQEVDKLCTAAIRGNDRFTNASINPSGNKKTISSWFTPGNDVFGYLERSEKIVNIVAQLLESDAPICHVHSKLMEKLPRVGGVWEWHQDYAYWSTNKFLFANQMVSVMVALTSINKENGCSQIIKGSHQLGEIKHGFEGEQIGADKEFVNNALETLELVYPELEAGDALFFNSNLLHRSDANLSDYSSWSNISCYSLQSNLAKKEMFTSWYTPVEIVPNEAILEWDTPIKPDLSLLYNKKIHALKETVWGQLVAIS